MNKKGFTLIELLAVIIILGILMIIAIPSVTRYISDSRKNAYVDTAKEIMGAAKNLVNSGDLEMYDTDTTYYIDYNCITTENAAKSPYDDFDYAYVVVTYDGKGYTYYWTSIDKAKQGIKNIIRFDKLDTDNVESDLDPNDISTLRGIDGRSQTIVVSKANKCQKEGPNNAEIHINGETGEEHNPVEYPEGKDRTTVEPGDLVKISNEEFYVIKRDGSNLILMAHYNLNVGNYKNSSVQEGIQHSSVRGKYNGEQTYGMVPFSTNDYWSDKIGTTYQPQYSGNNQYYYVYDSNSIIYNYIEQYKSYLESFGVNIKEARLPKWNEFDNISLNFNSIDLSATSFWFGTTDITYPGRLFTYITSNGWNLMSYNSYSTLGIRPIIVI